MIPINIYFTIDLITLIHKYWLENYIVTKENKDKKLQFKIINPDVVGNLDHLDYVIFDKTGTLTEKIFSLDSIFFGNRNFNIDYNLKEIELNPIFMNKNRESPENSNPSSDHDKDHGNPQAGFEFPNNESINIISGTGRQNQILKKGKSTPLPIFLDFHKKDSAENYINIEIESLSQDSSPNWNSLNQKREEFDQLVISKTHKVKEFLKCLSLTHNIGLMINPHRRAAASKKKEVYDLEDELLLGFCNFNGFGFSSCIYESRDHSFEESASITYNLRDVINGIDFKYNVLAINEFTHSRKIFSIFFQDMTEKQNVLYCKGKFEALKEKMTLTNEQKQTCEHVIKQYTEKGLRIIAFAKRYINEDDTYAFFDRYNSLKKSVVGQKAELLNLAIEMERNLELVAIIGIKDNMRSKSDKILKIFKEMNSKIWILTGDSFTNAFNAGANISLFTSPQENSFIHFKDINGENLRYFIRQILTEIKQSNFELNHRENALEELAAPDGDKSERNNSFDVGSKGKKYSKIAHKEAEKYFSDKIVFINGDALNTIFKDDSLKFNFIFIIALTQKIIGYNFSPDQKHDLVKIIKEKFYNSPTVLTIGDGYNDNLMMKISDVSIEICENIEQGINNVGDIQINDLACLKPLIKNYGKKCAKTLLFSIKLRFFQSFFLIFCLFFSNCLFYGKSFVDYENVTYFVILQSLDLLIVALFTREIKSDSKNKNNAIFPKSLQKNYKFSFLLFISLMMYSGITACFIYLFTFEILVNFEDNSGDTISGSNYNTFLFLVLFVINQEKILIFYVENKIQIWKILLHFVGLFIIIMVFCRIAIEVEIQDFLLKNAWLLIIIILIIFRAKFLFYYLIDQVLKQLKNFFLRLTNNNLFPKSDGM